MKANNENKVALLHSYIEFDGHVKAIIITTSYLLSKEYIVGDIEFVTNY